MQIFKKVRNRRVYSTYHITLRIALQSDLRRILSTVTKCEHKRKLKCILECTFTLSKCNGTLNAQLILAFGKLYFQFAKWILFIFAVTKCSNTHLKVMLYVYENLHLLCCSAQPLFAIRLCFLWKWP